MSPIPHSDAIVVPARVVRVTRGGEPDETLIVAKLTFELGPGTSLLASIQEPLALEGATYGPLSNSLRRIQDVAPPKPRSDVLVVGSAFAPGGAHDKAYEARVQVGTIDKAILVRPARFVERDGTVTIDRTPAETRLLYELARADEASNPFGVDGETPDESGRIPLPRFDEPDEGETTPKRVVGLGPIPLFPDWAVRPLGKNPGGGLELTWDGDASSLNAAPSDQRFDGAIPEGISVRLVNLHPSEARFATKLEWVRAIAHVPGAGSIPLAADTLIVDTDRCVCLVTYRGSLGAAHVDAWVEPRVELHRRAADKPLVPQMTAEFDAVDLADYTVDTPFARPSRPLPGEDTVELQRRDLLGSVPRPVDLPPIAPPPVPPPRESRPASAFEKPTYLARNDIAIPPPRASVPVTDGAASTPRGALQASNDALQTGASRTSLPSKTGPRLPRALGTPRDPPETIELLWFAPDVVPRLRTAPGLAEAFPENLESERFPTNATELGRDVRRALLFAKPSIAPQNEIALGPGDRKSGLYRTPLLLVVGELAVSFDARLTLEATLGAIDMLLPNEKTLRPQIEAAKKLFETEWVTTPPLDQAAQNLRGAVSKLRDPNAALVEPTVERLLLEKRAYLERAWSSAASTCDSPGTTREGPACRSTCPPSFVIASRCTRSFAHARSWRCVLAKTLSRHTPWRYSSARSEDASKRRRMER